MDIITDIVKKTTSIDRNLLKKIHNSFYNCVMLITSDNEKIELCFPILRRERDCKINNLIIYDTFSFVEKSKHNNNSNIFRHVIAMKCDGDSDKISELFYINKIKSIELKSIIFKNYTNALLH